MQESTEFSNDNIDVNQLPQIEQLKLKAISNTYRKTNVLLGLFISATLMLLLLGVKFQSVVTISDSVTNIVSIVLGVLIFIFLISTVYSYFADVRKFYALREQDLSYVSGLFFKKTVTQPMLRIQHVELKQGPIDRKVDLAKLQVFSAGGALHTFEIPGLTLKHATMIRQNILDHKNVINHG